MLLSGTRRKIDFAVYFAKLSPVINLNDRIYYSAAV